MYKCRTMCLENTPQQQTRWLRTMLHDNHFYLIESNEYATLHKGYAIKFEDQAEFETWLTQQLDTGWKLTFSADHRHEPVDHETLHQLELNIFKKLKS